jgi:hypothetical protein
MSWRNPTIGVTPPCRRLLGLDGDPLAWRRQELQRAAYRTVARAFALAVGQVQKALRAQGRNAGHLDNYSWHANRHTFASRLVMAGVDPKNGAGAWRLKNSKYGAAVRASGTEPSPRCCGAIVVCQRCGTSPETSPVRGPAIRRVGCCIVSRRSFGTRRASLNWQGSGLEIHDRVTDFGVRISGPPPFSAQLADSWSSVRGA